MKVAPWEMNGCNEIYHMRWNKDTFLDYHYHTIGTEVFFMRTGKMDFYLSGTRYTAGPDDIIVVPPLMPHAIKVLEESTFISFFVDVKYYQIELDFREIRKVDPSLLKKPEFMTALRAKSDRHECPLPSELSDTVVPQVRRKGTSLQTFVSNDVVYHLKVAPSEMGSMSKVWYMEWKEGMEVDKHLHHEAWENFYLTSGSFEADINGEVFTAYPGDLVYVPPFAPHSMKFLEDSTFVTFFKNVNYYALETDKQEILRTDPSKFEDEEYMKEFRKRHDSYRVE